MDGTLQRHFGRRSCGLGAFSAMAGMGVFAASAVLAQPSRPIAWCPPTDRPSERPVDPPAPHVDVGGSSIIQLALLLDTSNSMDNLIGQAKSRLWEVVSQLSKARRDGRAPRLEVAVYEYGNNSIPSDAGYVRRRMAFTTDLDKISECLFTLRTNGGDEYCGWAINDAVRDLSWKGRSTGSDDGDRCGVYRLVVIAGNEPFNQGAIDFKHAIRAARAQGIRVNTIFCGPSAEGELTGWREGAAVGGGRYTSINLDAPVTDGPTPYDAELMRLNAALNETYLPYGALGRESSDLQVAQDAANEMAGAGAARVAAKATGGYVNAHWDLVDAVDQKQIKLEELESDGLPPAMRRLDAKDRALFVDNMRHQRAQVQSQITTAAEKRRAFIEKEAKKSGQERLDDAILTAMREQAVEAGFSFE